MNYAEAKLKAIRLLNQYSNAGQLILGNDGNTLDYTLRFPSLFDLAQKEIASTAKFIHKVKRISQNPIPNLLPMPLYTFDVIRHFDTDLTDMVAKGAKSYYFEVDSVADIYIEEETTPGVWTNLKTINNAIKGQYTVFKGFTGVVDPSHNVRVRFSGAYPYNIRNKALFAYLFPTESDIPNYTKYVQYTLPVDFFMLNKVVLKGSQATAYTNTIDWNWEGRNVIAVNYFLIGEIDVFYYAYPATIDDTVADAYLFEIDEEAAQAMPFYVASQCLIDDPINKSVSTRLFDMYQNKLANLTNAVTQGSTSVKNSMFTTDEANKLF